MHSGVMGEIPVQNPHVHTDTSTPHLSVKVNLIHASIHWIFFPSHKYYHLMKELKFNLPEKEHQKAYDRDQEQLANLKMKAGKSFSK